MAKTKTLLHKMKRSKQWKRKNDESSNGNMRNTPLAFMFQPFIFFVNS